MKQDIKDKLDKEVIKSRIKFFAIFAIPTLIIVLSFIALFPISSTNIEGLAFKLTAKQTDIGNIPIILVKIENNEIIKASLPVKLEYMQGKKVELTKTKTLIGAVTYKVIRYVE